MTDKIAVFSMCETREQAEKLANALVERRLAACVNILPAAASVYHWQGKIENAEEIPVIIKSRRGLFPALREEILRLHSYDVPEVIALPILEGSPSYLQWLDKELLPDE